MAFHDDIDDANDANDKTSSGHDSELPFSRRAASSTPAAESADDSDESSSVDLDDEFQRSETSDDLDQGMPPWAMAPAPDPTQAVPQLDAPDGLSEEELAAVSDLEDADSADADSASSSSDEFASSKSVAAGSGDPYQIPVDYTTPDFFASRISGQRPTTDETLADGSANDARDDETTVEADDSNDFNFDSLFATEDPIEGPAASSPDSDAPWADVSPVADLLASAPAEEDSASNNVWKLGPLEPTSPGSAQPTQTSNSPGADAEAEPIVPTGDAEEEQPFVQQESFENLADVDPIQTPSAASADLSLADDEVIEGAPIWDLDEIDAPDTTTDPAPSEAFDVDALAETAEYSAAVDDDAVDQPTASEPVDVQDIPPPPVRRSMADDELLNWVDNPDNQSTGTLSVIEVLEAQLRLREEEAREYREWETTLYAKAVPVAEEAEEPTSVPSTPSEPQETVLAAPTAQLPAWDVPPPSESWAPGDDFDNEIPFAAHADPTGSITLPVRDEEATDQESQTDDAQPSPEFPADEEGDYDEITFTPPPLVEPTTVPMTPQPNLDEQVSFDDFGVTAPISTDDDVEVAPAAGENPAVDTTDDAEAATTVFSFASPQTPHYVPTEPLNFDDLLKIDDLDDLDDTDQSIEVEEPNPFDALIMDAGSLQPSDPLSTVETGSIPISEASPEAKPDDAVDAATSVFGAAVASTTTEASPVPAPMPFPTARLSPQPLDLEDAAPTAQRVFSLEESGLEPTPVDRRIGHAARLFWLWFAANSSIVSIGLGAAVFAVGMSLRQSVVAILAGVALSFIPLGLTTLAGKRSGQPTMVISRSTFGLLGNIVPSLVALVGRLFWGAVLLWVLASSVAIVLIGSDLNVGLGDRQLLLIALALSFLVALVIAFAGYPLFARIQLILSIISGVLVIGLIAFTAQHVDVSQALTAPDGSWLLTLTGAVLVFSFLGLVWAYSGADIARYQRVSSSGPAAALSASFGATLPAFALIAYGALLAASDPALARGFLASPLDTLLPLLPGWYPIPLLLAAALSLLSGITLSLYSGGFALQAVGVRLPRQWSIVIVSVLLGALSVLFAFGVNGGINELFRDVATTLAVPTAAWVGIFAAETMIRTRRLDSAALTTRGGIYADVRWANLTAFILISVIGFALTSATIGWLSWQGYGFEALGIDLSSELAASDLGVLVALVLGMLTPIVAGIPAIKRQEAGSSEQAVRPA